MEQGKYINASVAVTGYVNTVQYQATVKPSVK
jgi:putative cofactor-binding repeat protein